MAFIRQPQSAETAGLVYGFLGVLGFSLTLPATRIAVAELDPTFVGLGRALVAASMAALLLTRARQPRPNKRQLYSLLLVAAGVVIGFPLLSAWAMRRVPASHGAIMLGILPLATAIAGTIRAGERPSLGFWLASAIGSCTVIGFAVLSGGGAIHAADVALVVAVLAAALGYAEGGRLARELGGWQVICWALVIVAPLLIAPVAFVAFKQGLAASVSAWLAFVYVSLISMFLAFFAWYRGLALGGVARVGQVQLLQPFLTIAASSLLLGEEITVATVVASAIVIATVAVGRRAAVKR